MINKAFTGDTYTLDEFIAFVESEPEGRRYELIDGYIRAMASPSWTHQLLAGFIWKAFDTFFEGKDCEAIQAFDVFLLDEDRDCQDCYEPDVLVICDKSKVTERAVKGAPDLAVEIISESSRQWDNIVKLNNYARYGVKEYWVVDYALNKITVHSNLNTDDYTYEVYTFGETAESKLFDGLRVDFSKFKDRFD